VKQKIMVTGGSGFIGYNICKYFHSKKNQIVSVDKTHIPKKLKELEGWEKRQVFLPSEGFQEIVREFKPDIIIHCAGSADVTYSVREPYIDFQNNVSTCQFILNTIKEEGRKCKFILLSSAAVYGNPKHIPVNEKDVYMPISPYGYHKMMCEQTLEMYSQIYNIQHAALRIFSAYGIGLNKQVIYDLCKKATDKENKQIIVFGTGDETRDFIHIYDIVQAVECIIQNNGNGIYNVATGIQTPIKDIVNFIVKSTNCKKDIIFTGNTRKGDPLLWQADISKIASLGFKQRINLEQGIEQYCKWFLNNI
jgi:nucleoside-diphosphate-sugar epimerase